MIAIHRWAGLLPAGLVVLLLLPSNGNAGGPKPDIHAPSLVEKVTSELVLIEAYVTDLRGQALKGLDAGSFVLLVDGKVAPIASLEYREVGPEAAAGGPGAAPEEAQALPEPAAPRASRRFVLYFEDDLSAAQGLTMARRAAAKFIGADLLPTDQVALVAHGKQVRVLCDFTTDRATLLRALDRSLEDPGRVSTFSLDLLENEKVLRENWWDTPSTGGNVFVNDIHGAGSTTSIAVLRVDTLISTFAKEDAARVRRSLDVIRSLVAALAPWPGYKAVVYMGDGIPENPATYYLDRLHDIPVLASSPQLSSDVEVLNLRSEFKALVDAAGAGGVTVHTIDTAGIAPADAISTPGSSVRRAAQHRSSSLPTIALNTGGISSFSNDLLKGLADAEVSSRAYYVIGYAPEGPPDGRTHSVQLRVKKVSARLSWRRQFVRLRPEETRERSIQSAHLLPELYPNFGLDLSVVTGPVDKAGRVADLVLHVPSDRILFLPGEGGATAHLDVGLVALDSSHRELLRLSRNLAIRLSGPAGVHPGLDLFHRTHLPAAADTITAVVTDLATGAVGALRIGGPLRFDDDPGILGLSIYSLVERSLWVEMPTGADSDPTEATVRDDQLGPALKSSFAVGEPLACGFKLKEPRDAGDALIKVSIRHGETVVKTVEIGPESGFARGMVKAKLPVEELPAGDYFLLVQGMRAGRAVDLARRPFKLL